MSDIYIFVVVLGALLFAFSAGHSIARRSSQISVIDKWPHAHIQFDSTMSEADMLRFLDMARDAVLAGPERSQTD